MIRTILFLFIVLAPLYLKASTIDTLAIFSKSMNKNIANLVILPEGYEKINTRYPVLYLLHGAGGDHTSWLNVNPAIRNYADKYQMIVVCPDGSPTSWYFDSPIDPAMKYETYVAHELIAGIDQTFPTIAQKEGRAITGLSMGGHGALYLACKHPDLYGAVGSTSGGVDIRPFPERWDIAKRLGDIQSFPDRWENNTVINLVHNLKDQEVKFIFDCGVDDFFYGVNKALHEKLLDLEIPHDYIVRPGGHSRAYWKNAIAYQVLFFSAYFEGVQELVGEE